MCVIREIIKRLSHNVCPQRDALFAVFVWWRQIHRYLLALVDPCDDISWNVRIVLNAVYGPSSGYSLHNTNCYM